MFDGDLQRIGAQKEARVTATIDSVGRHLLRVFSRLDEHRRALADHAGAIAALEQGVEPPDLAPLRAMLDRLVRRIEQLEERPAIVLAAPMPSPVLRYMPPPVSTAAAPPAGEKRGRGRPKGSLNRKTLLRLAAAE